MLLLVDNNIFTGLYSWLSEAFQGPQSFLILVTLIFGVLSIIRYLYARYGKKKVAVIKNTEVVELPEPPAIVRERNVQLIKDSAQTLEDTGGNRESIQQLLAQLDKPDFTGAFPLLKQAAERPGLDSAILAFINGGINQLQGNYDEAARLYENAFKLQPDNSLYLRKSGVLMNIRGKHQLAIPYFEKALALDTQKFGEKHKAVVTGNFQLGYTYKALREYHKAVPYYEKALEFATEAFGEKDANLPSLYSNLGEVCYLAGEYTKALGYYEKVLTSLSESPGDHGAAELANNYNLGLAYMAMGDNKKALDYFNQALAYELTQNGEIHAAISRYYDLTGSCYSALGEHKKAVENIQRALEIDLRLNGKKHPSIAYRYNSLGRAYYEMGDIPKAIDYTEQARSILKKSYKNDHPDMQAIIHNIGFYWSKLNKK